MGKFNEKNIFWTAIILLSMLMLLMIGQLLPEIKTLEIRFILWAVSCMAYGTIFSFIVTEMGERR